MNNLFIALYLKNISNINTNFLSFNSYIFIAKILNLFRIKGLNNSLNASQYSKYLVYFSIFLNEFNLQIIIRDFIANEKLEVFFNRVKMFLI